MSGFSTSPYYGSALEAAMNQNINPSVFTGLIGQESSYNPNAYNASSGASGIAQFLPSTYSGLGYDSSTLGSDPEQEINASAGYFSSLYQQSGSYVSALQQYGTLPSDLSNLSSGQQQLYQTALAADNAGGGSGYNMPATNPGDTVIQIPYGTPTLGSSPSVTEGSGLGSTSNSGAAWGSPTGSGTGVGLTNLLSNINSASLWQRVGMVVVGLIFLLMGLFLLGSRQAEVVVNNLPAPAKKAVETAAVAAE